MYIAFSEQDDSLKRGVINKVGVFQTYLESRKEKFFIPQNNELKMYSCAYIMDTQLKANPYIVERLIYPGLYILAGAPKITIHNLRISKIMHEKSK